MKSRFIIIPILVCLMLTLITSPAFAKSFQDVENHWAKAQIEKWVSSGLASGYPDGSFRPNQQVTRAEFVSLVNRAFKKQYTAGAAGFKFNDVKETDWFYKEVASARHAGYLSGYEDGAFLPNKPISRQEAASIVMRLLKLDTPDRESTLLDAAQFPAWSKATINAVIASGIMGGYPDGTFKPVNSITRAEAVATLDRAMSSAPTPAPVETFEGVKGSVTLNGKAVDGAEVRLYAATGHNQEKSFSEIKKVTTGKDGKYQFTVPPGNYDLTAKRDKHVAFATGVNVAKNSVMDLALAEGAVINGKLNDSNGNVVKNAKLIFVMNPPFFTTTDNDGKFSIYVPGNKKYSVLGYQNNNNNSKLITLAQNVQAGNPGTKLETALNAPYALPDSVTGGGSVVTPKDTEAPKLVKVSYTLNGKSYTINGNPSNIYTIDMPRSDSNNLTALLVRIDEVNKMNMTITGTNVSMLGVNGFQQLINDLGVNVLTPVNGQIEIDLKPVANLLSLFNFSIYNPGTTKFIEFKLTDTEGNYTNFKVNILVAGI